MKQFIWGFTRLQQGFSLIRQPGLRRFAVAPLLINICVFALLGLLSYQYFSQWLGQLTPFKSWHDIAIVRWMASVLRFLFGTMLVVASVFVFTLVANIIAAPFNSLLAERVELHLRGQNGATDNQTLMALLRSIPKTLWSEVRKILYLLGWIIPIGILYLIPGLQLLAPFVMLLFGAWLLALEYLDYPMGNNNHRFKEVKQRLKQRRMLSLGFGSAVTLLSAIPVINLIAMPTAVAAATALWVSHFSENSIK